MQKTVQAHKMATANKGVLLARTLVDSMETDTVEVPSEQVLCALRERGPRERGLMLLCVATGGEMARNPGIGFDLPPARGKGDHGGAAQEACLVLGRNG